MSNTCSICLEEIKISDSFQKWNCSHRFHKECTKFWNKSCPLCRTIERINEVNCINKKNVLNLKKLKQINNIIPEEYQCIYKDLWNDKVCLRNNHSIWLFNPYGVIGICEDCNTIQNFLRMH